MCFRFPDPHSAKLVAAQLASLHPRVAPDVTGDCVHVTETLWAKPLTPEVLVGSLGRLTPCTHLDKGRAPA
jgi:hypothetical protein